MIACSVCLALCACTPHNSEIPETTPAPTEPDPTPGMTIIAPWETPVEIIDPVNSEDDPVNVPVDPPDFSTDDTPEPPVENRPDDSEDDPVNIPVDPPDSSTDDTPEPPVENSPDDSEDDLEPVSPVVPDTTSSGGIDLPFIPA